MKNLLQALLGSMSPSVFISAMIFCLIGFIIQKRLSYIKGKDKPRTPLKFSWEFWFKDNLDDILIQLLITFVLVRFAPDIILYFFPQSREFFERADAMVIYLVLGFLSTRIVKIIKDKQITS